MKSTKARVFRATGDGREIQRDGTDVCRVVKAGNTLLAAVLASNPRQAGGNRVLFVSGDDVEAKTVVSKLLGDLDFATVDLGTLAAGARLQQFPGGSLPTLNLIKLP